MIGLFPITYVVGVIVLALFGPNSTAGDFLTFVLWGAGYSALIAWIIEKIKRNQAKRREQI